MMQIVSDNPSPLMADNIGTPAVPVGSPSSEQRSVPTPTPPPSESEPELEDTNPKQTCRLFGCSFRIVPSMDCASPHDVQWEAKPMNRDFLITSSAA